MEVFCPADEEELTQALPFLLARPNPCYVRYNASKPAFEHTVPFEFGKAEILSHGSEITILAFGTLLGEARKAAGELERQGRSVRLVNLRTLKPLDEEAVLNAARETTMMVTLEDHFRTGGLASIVSELLFERGVSRPFLPIALEDRWFKPALLADVLVYEGFTGAQIAERITERWKFAAVSH
jgi:transketolase